MNIGFDAKRAFHNTSGLGNYSRDLIRILSQELTADEFFLFNPKEPQIEFDYNKNNSQVVKPIKGFYAKSGSLWRRFRLAGLAKEMKLNVYHGLSNELPFQIKKSGVKTIVTIHDLIFERYPEWYSRIDRTIYQKKFKSAAIQADVVVAISEQTKRDLVELYGIDPNKIKVLYQGCHQAFHKRYGKETKSKVQEKFKLPDNYILNVGTIENRKNILTVIQALKTLENIPLVIVGRLTAYGEEAFKWAKDNGMSDRILHLKDVSMFELAVINQMAKIFVYPSVFEGFGIPIIEALFSKTPVITSKGSCFSEAGGPDSLYLDYKNVNSWKENIEKLWNDNDTQKKMAENGSAFAERFKDQNILNSWKELYNEFR